MADVYTEVSTEDPVAQVLAAFAEIVMPEGAVHRIRRKSDGVILWESATPGAAPLAVYSDMVQAGVTGILYTD